ncbi:DedA family protein [Sanguibacter antarcticus]|uniref:Membrane protein DedA with SNARE-associated domain n=1 Tax=Sanguibacter antarcticus TaxID=372484 RepID=A0A2A9E558_9MICO|nr:VTT domain-containing protein [Sanguibacter antarcticus]PFG33983.1 membrane protein DedA with SNARE-associated domain [Sanguibacter antarcticus]
MLDGLGVWAESLAASPWVFVILFAFVAIDAFFPPVPSESLVIALAAVSLSTGSPDPWALAGVAAVAAFTGDIVAYTIGRRIDVHRLPLLRGRRVQSAFVWADRAFRQRPAPIIIAARYIPVGRVAVNMTAGALRYRRRSFVGLAGIAAVTWSAYSTLIGIGAGTWLHGNPLLAVVVGVTGGTAIGFLVDYVLGRVLRLRGPHEHADPHEASRASEKTTVGS